MPAEMAWHMYHTTQTLLGYLQHACDDNYEQKVLLYIITSLLVHGNLFIQFLSLQPLYMLFNILR